MLNTLQGTSQANFNGFTASTLLSEPARREIYERERARVYAIAFWVTGSEMAAEDLMVETFAAAFAETAVPSADDVDQALLKQLRKEFRLPVFTLHCAPCIEVKNLRRNQLRTELEGAVIALPATEKLIFILHDIERYGHQRIARLLEITERESQLGLHQARLRLRELLAN
jgi:DNA-directed RNA polymerase specialized sigma24 family protein